MFLSKGDPGELQLNQLQLFPNPSSNQLQIILPDNAASNIKLQIIDLNGAIIMEKTINGSMEAKQQLQTIDITGLKQGMYLVKVISNGTTQSMRFIKE